MAFVGIIGGTFVVVFIMLVSKPIYESMKEDIFLKIGANQNVWGKKLLK